MDKRKNQDSYNKRGKLQIRGFDEYLRNFLLKVIEQDYNSLSKFCEQSDFERNDLRKYIKGDRNWSFSKVFVLLHELGYQTLALSKDYITETTKQFEEFEIIREGVSLKEKKIIRRR